MACTLEELQDVEYEILCRFADFCDKYSIEYVLAGGTLLGAVRHSGFIPWDDDVDIHMDARQYRKFMRKLKKHPMEGLHLSWVGTEKTYPFWFGKLRKDGTHMPEQSYNNLDIHHGVWVDLFCYTGYPDNKLLAKIQDKVYDLLLLLTKVYRYEDNGSMDNGFTYSKKFKLLAGIPAGLNCKLRAFLFWLFSILGKKDSKYVVYNDWGYKRKKPALRENDTPGAFLPFRDREFSVPKNYKIALELQYGDYMTPKVYPTHTDFSKVDL